MKKTIKPTFAFLIYNNILTLPLLALCVFGLHFRISEKDLFGITIIGLFMCLCLLPLSFGIYETQWIKLKSDNISVYNIFGLVKTQNLSNTKRAILADIRVYNFKGFFKTKPFIVLSTRKSIILSDIYIGNNTRKKNPYVIIPYTSENSQIIKQAYFEITGQELNIGL